MSILTTILLVFHLIVSFLIIFVTLMQRPKNEGLGAAFGGGMTENLFGAQTSNVLATFTRWLGGIFFVLTMALSMLYARSVPATSEIQKQLLSRPKPVASATPAASPANASAEAAKQKVINSVQQAVEKASKGETTAPAGNAAKTPAIAPAATPATLPSASPAGKR